VQSQLGHASIQTTVDRYGRLMPDAHVGASEKLDATLFGRALESLDDKMLTSAPHKEKARSSMSLGLSLCAGAGFEPTTFGL